jgi:hypothetical protein
LNQWKPPFYSVAHKHFGFWVIAHLPATAQPAFRAKLAELQLQNADTKAFFIQRGIERDSAQNDPIAGSQIFIEWPDDIPLTRTWSDQVFRKCSPNCFLKATRQQMSQSSGITG